MPTSTEHPRSRVQCLDPGPLQPLVDRFTDHLVRQGHTALTVSGYDHSARHFTVWLQQSGIALAQSDDSTCADFAAHQCRCPGIRRRACISVRYARRARRFVRFLSGCGIASPLAPPELAPMEPRLALFQDWLRRHRGIAECTIAKHGRMIARLLPTLGADPGRYDAASIRSAVLNEASSSSAAHVKTMTTALRGYLRFLGASGACRPDLVHAVPVVPQWRLSALPRHLLAGDVERLIASCDTGKAQGIRDKAIMLLLARLGLRAGDVLALRLGHIDWADGTVRVRGKSRRETCLPLPQDAGDALLEYICRARPASDSDAVFLRSAAPYQPFAGSSTVSALVRLALARAGIADPPSRGANLLRHSAATSMLRAGATLDTIGAVLRHRSATATAHYAKVDISMLLHVAQRWPEEASC